MKGSWSLLAVALAVGLSASAPAFAGDAAAGEKVFAQCNACHTKEAGKNRIGPSLFGIVGRKSATIETFQYSDAMKKAGLTWDAANLDKYLADPKATVPGNKMTFAGLSDATKRADVIAYLATLK